LPFQEAIDFFRQKVDLPSQAWTDLRHGMHDRAFVVAGVTRQDVLTDLRAAVEKAIAQGTTLETFKKDFAAAIEGKWEPKQSRGWRARIIYEANIRTAYAAGRWGQLQSMTETHPYWEYRIGYARHHRPEHQAWDGLVLPANDAWFLTHYPPCEWECHCYVVARDEGDLKRLGKSVSQAPPEDLEEKPWGNTGTTIATPKGVGPGWGYAPGKQAFDWPAASPIGAKADATRATWKPLDGGNWESAGRPRLLESRPAEGKILPKSGDAVEVLRNLLGGDEKLFQAQLGRWNLPLVVNAERLGGHLPADRTPFLGLLPDAMRPQEIWAQFLESDQGRLALRWRLVTAVEAQGKKLALVAEGNGQGVLEALTFIPISNANNLNKLRVGRLVAWE
jgi:hypothetical protein